MTFSPVSYHCNSMTMYVGQWRRRTECSVTTSQAVRVLHLPLHLRNEISYADPHHLINLVHDLARSYTVQDAPIHTMTPCSYAPSSTTGSRAVPTPLTHFLKGCVSGRGATFFPYGIALSKIESVRGPTRDEGRRPVGCISIPAD